ncbi:MAG TPA: hypothetical protein VMV49_07605 [Candidatus Deferrimicrobium sp.]|nr:hypothetical protein [Candidatus Deferrimicrobium sp.]
MQKDKPRMSEKSISSRHSIKLSITQAIPHILKIKESTPLITAGRDLFHNIFLLLLEKSQQSLTSHETLIDLLKKTRHYEVVQKFFNPIWLWVRKIETRTPFFSIEIRKFKKFLLLFLLDLDLLPTFLKDAIIPHIKLQESQTSPPQRSPPLLNPQLDNMQKGAKQHEHKEELRLPPPPVANFDVANIPFNMHVAISGPNASYLRKMREDERNGI